MNLNETSQILDYIAAADGRSTNEQTYKVWFDALNHLQFATAQQAAIKTIQDVTVKWAKPIDILQAAGRLLEVEAQDKRRELSKAFEEPSTGSPMPVCVHGVGLLYCGPCCHEAAIVAELISPRVYKKKLLV